MRYYSFNTGINNINKEVAILKLGISTRQGDAKNNSSFTDKFLGFVSGKSEEAAAKKDVVSFGKDLAEQESKLTSLTADLGAFKDKMNNVEDLISQKGEDITTNKTTVSDLTKENDGVMAQLEKIVNSRPTVKEVSESNMGSSSSVKGVRVKVSGGLANVKGGLLASLVGKQEENEGKNENKNNSNNKSLVAPGSSSPQSP